MLGERGMGEQQGPMQRSPYHAMCGQGRTPVPSLVLHGWQSMPWRWIKGSASIIGQPLARKAVGQGLSGEQKLV